MTCAGAEHFLGHPADFAWWTRVVPAPLIGAVMEFVDGRLEGWQLIKVKRARDSKKLKKVQVVDEGGQSRFVYAEARYYLRNGNHWLVLDISPQHGPGGLLGIDVASSGTPEGWGEAFLVDLDKHLSTGAGLGRARMLADGEPLPLERPYGWEELFLAPETKQLIVSETVGFFEHRALYEKMDLSFRRGVLLSGPPGTGKTLIGKILASQLSSCSFVWITPRHVEQTNDVKAIFSLARYGRRVVLFFEDLDFYASRRDHLRATPMLGELLVQLDGMHSNDGMLVIATTNDLEAIELALKERPSRFDRVIEVKAAPPAVRVQHLLHLLGPYGVTESDLRPFVRRTDGFSGAQLQELAVRARISAAQRNDAKIVPDDLVAATQAAAAFKASTSTIGFDRQDGDDFD